MTDYTIKEKAKKEAEYLITKIRKLIKVRRTMEANHKLNELSDIFLNIKEVKPNGNEK